MAHSSQGTIKIVNLKRFYDTWSKENVADDIKTKPDFTKSMKEMGKIMQLKVSETEKAEHLQKYFKRMKETGTLQRLPDSFQRDFSNLFHDEKKDETKVAKDGTNKRNADTPPTQSSPENIEEGNQGVDVGPVPKHSSHSPTQVKHITGITVRQNVHKDTEDMKQKMETLEKLLAEEQGKVQQQEQLLKAREKELTELETDKKTEIETLEGKVAAQAQRLEEKDIQWDNIKRDLDSKQDMNVKLEAQVNEYASQEVENKKAWEQKDLAYKKLEKEKHQAEKARQRDIEQFQKTMEDESRKFDGQYKKLLMERDDLRDRFSKLAGAKLQEKNADIADLSDPNRAMKLSERFGQIYDDEWTNAFENLTDKKLALPLKDAIALLLRFLQDCWSFCNKLMTTQMDSLHNVFLHPSQNSANFNPKQSVGGMNDRPRIGSKDDKALFALRRQIGVSPTVIEEVKQALLSEFKTLNKDKMGYEKKHIEACTPYLQKCAEICWLMALHDPPLFMKMDVKPGEKLNPNIYSVYSSSGNTIDFLVWPPLLNGIDGGLLAKGVAEPQRTVGRKK